MRYQRRRKKSVWRKLGRFCLLVLLALVIIYAGSALLLYDAARHGNTQALDALDKAMD